MQIKLKTTEDKNECRGLTDEEVADRRGKGQVNGNHNARTKTIAQIIRGNVCTLFNLINVALAACIVFVNSYKNMLFFGVILCNVLIGIIQEIRAKRVIDKLSLIASPKTKVLRNYIEKEIDMQDIVLDDYCVLRRGDQVCADSVIMNGSCEVDESLLTGESDPVFKKEGDEILSGSFLVSGDIETKVIHVGSDNYAYKIVHEAKYMKKPASEMMDAINKIIRIVSYCILPLAAILFYKQMVILGQPLEQAVVGTVASIVAMIPEGLVLLTSVVLAVSVVRLSKEKTLVQELYCIETLARVDVLCLDKTGTLTEGKMQVEQVVLLDNKPVDQAISAMMNVLNDANPTFVAMKEKFHEAIHWKAVQKIPFSSEKKWSMVAFETQGTYVLGAAEYVLGSDAKAYQKTIAGYAEEGLRVLVLSYTDSLPDGKNLPKDLKPLAFLLLGDKIRKEAKDTLEFFSRQGVKLKIISGDHPTTVSSIARKAGLSGAENYVDATTLTTEDELINAANQYTVFGRVTPHQKLGLIKALKAKGSTVGMTGDGVNDVLALKEADCSVAMQSGSDAARNVSKLVLLNSNFASMPKIVAEGRRSINNLERSATLFLVKTIYAFLLAIIFVFVDRPYPFTPIQLTLVNVLTIGIPSFLLALEPNYNLVKGHFLKNVLRSALPGGVLVVINILFIELMSVYVGAGIEQTATLATIMTGIVSFLVLFRICWPFNLFRIIMFCFLAGAFVVALLLFRELFNVALLTVPMYFVIAGQALASALLLPVFVHIVGRKL